MYQAPFVALFLAAVGLYRQGAHACERRHRREAPEGTQEALLGRRALPARRALVHLALQYYTPMFVGLAVLIACEICTTIEVLAPTGWLDPERVQAAFVGETPLPDWWESELRYVLGNGQSWLRWLSLMSPIFVVLTFLVSALHTFQHAAFLWRRGRGLCESPGHDKAIIIIALPLVYGIMSLRSVVRMWGACVNYQGGDLQVVDLAGERTWLARLVVRQTLYKTNFMVADLYEAVALYQFALLTLAFIRVRSRDAFRQAAKTGLPEVQLALETADREQRSVETLTVQGIYLFIFTCLLESAYFLLTTSVEVFAAQTFKHIPASIMKFNTAVYGVREQVHYFFLGMGTISSSAAIGNIVAVDLTMHDILKTFRPGGKFWSVKVLVSLAFLQSLVLYVPPFNDLSVTEGSLFYASALCAECFGVSLFLMAAWPPSEEWYEDLAEQDRCSGSLTS